MSRLGHLVLQTTGEVLLTRVQWCSSFACKLRGLMFRRQLPPGEGLLLVEAYESRASTAIHMLFMAFPIAAIWLDSSFRVVDKVLAKPWRPAYAPARAARYTLETHPDVLNRVSVGDVLSFEDVQE